MCVLSAGSSQFANQYNLYYGTINLTGFLFIFANLITSKATKIWDVIEKNTCVYKHIVLNGKMEIDVDITC